MLRNILLLFVLFGQVIPHLAGAEAVSILGPRQFLNERRVPVFQAPVARRSIPDVQVASLFVDRAETSLFAPPPVRERTIRSSRADPSVDRLRSLIGQAESRRHGYDAVQHGARVRHARGEICAPLRVLKRCRTFPTSGSPECLERVPVLQGGLSADGRPERKIAQK